MANGLKFRVATYNVLAEIYATQTMYPYCDHWALTWNYRKVGWRHHHDHHHHHHRPLGSSNPDISSGDDAGACRSWSLYAAPSHLLPILCVAPSSLGSSFGFCVVLGVQENLLREMGEIGADILFLQEVQADHYDQVNINDELIIRMSILGGAYIILIETLYDLVRHSRRARTFNRLYRDDILFLQEVQADHYDQVKDRNDLVVHTMLSE
jgi:hypothetical protein